jgi:acyl carrier protein
MESNKIYEQLGTIFQDVFDDDDIVPTAQTSAADVEGWDSLSHIRLILSVERAFKIRFSAAETGKLANVGELERLIAAKLQADGR